MQNIYLALIVTLCCVIWPIAFVCFAVWNKKPQPLFKDTTRLQRKIFTIVFTVSITLFVFAMAALHDLHGIFDSPHQWDSFAMFSLVMGAIAMLFAGLVSLPLTAAISESIAKNQSAN